MANGAERSPFVGNAGEYDDDVVVINMTVVSCDFTRLIWNLMTDYKGFVIY